MVSIKKALFILSLLFFEIQGVFAGFLSNSLGNSLGDFNKNVLQNTNVMLFIFFISLLFGTFTIFKGALRLAFKSKEQYHQKEINVIAFMMAIIGTAGLFFLFKDKGSEYIVNLFGGIFGLLIMLILAIFIMRGFVHWAHSFPEENKRIRIGIYWIGMFISFGLIDSYLVFLAQKLFSMPDWLIVVKNITDTVFFIAAIGAIIFGFMFISKIFTFNEKNKSPEKKNRDALRIVLKEILQEKIKTENFMDQLTTNLENLNKLKGE